MEWGKRVKVEEVRDEEEREVLMRVEAVVGSDVGLSPVTALKASLALRVRQAPPPLSPPSPHSRDTDDDAHSRDSRGFGGGDSREGDASSSDGGHPDSPSVSVALKRGYAALLHKVQSRRSSFSSDTLIAV